jgi:endonuclease/exonuclease/phosphatase family metal-dependent hydrolase
MGIISFKKIAAFMDPVIPPHRLRGEEQHDYDKSDESRWLQGGATAKNSAANFGLYHSKSKGLFQVHQGNSNSFREIGERHVGIKSQYHKMLVYNTYLLNSLVKSAEDRVARSMDIGRMIGREGYDIACLCEVFDGDDGKRIKKNIDRYGGVWGQAFGPDSSILNISGGLYGLVKKEKYRNLIRNENKEFSDGGEGADEFSNKGWLLMEIDLGPGILDVFSTHTDADVEDEATRKVQIGELIRAIKKRQNKYPDHITMAVGDFNVYSSNSEYKWFLEAMLSNCSMRDVWLTRGGKASATHAFNNRLCINSGPPDCACEDYNKNSYGGDRLDYIFVQDPKPQHPINIDMSRIRRKPFPRHKPCGDLDPKRLAINFMSDHLGLEIEFVSSARVRT